MKLELKRNPESNTYCVPTALALITNLPVDEIISLLRDELGDQEITGLYYPIGLKILVHLGYQYRRIDLKLLTISRLHPEKFYYCTTTGHCFVIHDHKYWDNQNPNGIDANKKISVTQCWEVWK